MFYLSVQSQSSFLAEIDWGNGVIAVITLSTATYAFKTGLYFALYSLLVCYWKKSSYSTQNAELMIALAHLFSSVGKVGHNQCPTLNKFEDKHLYHNGQFFAPWFFLASGIESCCPPANHSPSN